MVINLSPELEAALNEVARYQGVAPEEVVLKILRDRVIIMAKLIPRDEWERGLLGIAKDCGVSLSNWALSSEGLYD